MSYARRWSWLIVLVVGVAMFEAVRRVLLTTGNPNFVPALIVLGASVAPLAFVTVLRARRRPYGVGAGVIALTALFGGVIGTVTAGLLEYDTLRDLGGLPLVLVGLIEESVKLIIPLVVLLVLRPRHVADGLLVGVAAGAGFAALETMGYAFVELIRTGGNLAAVDVLLLLRGVLSPSGHMAWTGLATAALWYAAAHRAHPQAWGVFAGVFVLVVALHTGWDSSRSIVLTGALAVLDLALLLLVTHRLVVGDRVAHGVPSPAGAAGR